MAYANKGITFGLIYIPVSLNPAVKSGDISFNLLDKNTMSRVKYKKTCVDCGGKEVKEEDIVKGYEYEKGKYVVFEDGDFEKIKTKKENNITIERFVDIEEIDPVYFDKAYYAKPTGAEKAYALLAKAMEDENKAGLAKTVLGTKEVLMTVRAKDGILLVNTLHFEAEIQKKPEISVETTHGDKELEMAKTIIKAMTDKFNAGEYRDEYTQKVKAAIEAKIEGRSLSAPEEKEENVTNLMEALKLTLKKYSPEEKPKKAAKRA